MPGRNCDDISVGGSLRRPDQVAFGGQMQRRTWQAVGYRPRTYAPASRPRQVHGKKILDQLPGGGIGQGLTLIGPFLELDEPARIRAFGVEPAELGELAHGSLGIERPE